MAETIQARENTTQDVGSVENLYEQITRTKDDVKNRLDVSAKGVGNLITWDWDAFSVDYPSATSEIYSFYKNGPSGTLVGQITINYSDSTKEALTGGEAVAF